MITLAEVSSDLDRAARLIGAAREVVEGGKIVDLTGLDKLVQEACTKIEALTEGERAAVKPLLISLIDSLNGLVASLGAQRGEVAGELGELSSRSRATTAYGKGAATRFGPKGSGNR